MKDGSTQPEWLGRFRRRLWGLPGWYPRQRDDRRGLGLALTGAATMALVQPPADWWLLAW